MFLQRGFVLETSLEHLRYDSNLWHGGKPGGVCGISVFVGGRNCGAVPRWLIEASVFLICRYNVEQI